MFSKLHERLGTAGFVVAVVALVAALAGTAFAAAGLNSTQQKEVKKIAKQFAGKSGAPGAPGPQGPAGPAGANGKDGTNGTSSNGENGKSVIIGTATNVQCESGGITVEVQDSGTKKPVCNGETGFTETLPEGKTETGVWGTPNISQKRTTYDISFNIPLATAPAAVIVTPGEMESGAGATNGCPWDGTGTPTANSGTFCVYEAVSPSTANLTTLQVAFPDYEEFLGEFIGFGEAGAATFGAAVRTACTGNAEAECEGFGAWAVTAE
jgi:hypothetical protein